MKTVITSTHETSMLSHEGALQNHGIVNDRRFISLNEYLQENHDNQASILLKLSALLQKQKDHFPLFGDMFVYPAFLTEILSFAKRCILYSISPDTLPDSSSNEEELKRIMQIACSLPLVEKDNLKEAERILSKDVKDVELRPLFLRDHYHYELYEKLKETAAWIPYPVYNAEKSLHYALNPRQEAESIAQDICRKDGTCLVILTSPSAQYPLFESIFERYHIPFTTPLRKKPIRTGRMFHALLLFALEKDPASFLESLKLNAFSYSASDELYRFLSTHLKDMRFTFESADNLSNTVFENEKKRYEALVEEAKELYDAIAEELEPLLSASLPSEMMYAAFNQILLKKQLHDPDELKCLEKIRESILSSREHIQNASDLLFFARSTETTSVPAPLENSEDVIITDLSHPYPQKDYSYIVSLSGANFPSFSSETGLFDETYLEKVPGYPARHIRYHEYMTQLDWVHNSAVKHIYYSGYTNDYQGREVQFAFDIEAMFDHSEKWDLDVLAPWRAPMHTLNEETAQSLFLQDEKIHGSISTIERFFACPYAYFLQSGLKLRKMSASTLDAAGSGNIQHSVLQHAIEQYHKQYANITKEEVEELLRPCFEALDTLEPENKQYHDLSFERMSESLMQSLHFLSKFENASSFEPFLTEYKFESEIASGVQLKGTIDRADHYAKQLVRIIDYKSSRRTLSETKVKSGAQLQLLSYLIIAQRTFNLTPAGAYYFSLKEEEYSVDAAKLSRNAITETEWDEEIEAMRQHNTRKLNGWTMTDRTTELDESGDHINGLNVMYSYEAVEKCITLLYEYFFSEVTHGNIRLDPTEDACNFCDYKSICRFHGIHRKAAPIVMRDEPLKIKKGADDE